MDLEKLRNYPWGLYSFDFLLKQIDKTKHKLEQKEGYMMEGFLFGFQIWIMEVVPALGEICGTKVSKNFTGPLCGNWRGCAKCSYEDIIGVENLFPKKGILHSFMESHIDGVILLATDFVEKDEKKDERKLRAPNLRKLAKKKEENQAADTERGENSHVAENVDGTADVSGRNNRKHADRGAESRKKNVLCQLAASSKGNIDTYMKNLGGLVQASFTTFGEKFCQQFSDRLGKIETEVTQLWTASEKTEQFETRNIQVFDCGGRKKIKEVEAFAQLIPRIVKAVQSLTVQKHLTITPYNVSYVPMSGLN
ncbi:PREDICTED: uncharacterized protein LOC106315071 [Brassica oleracea var. oleracea]|uniref:uncharacterized protein LOC106315071 n=1 Tax=Brassica oleracea var. oleracea TaxID=109376 RepID=UPI0006A6FEB3|nr:PREDICTED: uncharacterized protein LOC106315071 [Brassica oleracea var. oleracea]